MKFSYKKVLEFLGFDYINSILHYISTLCRSGQVKHRRLDKPPDKKDWKLPPVCPHANPVCSVAMFISHNIQCVISVIFTTIMTALFIYGLFYMRKMYNQSDNGNSHQTVDLNYQYNWIWVGCLGLLSFGGLFLIIGSIVGMMIGLFGFTCFMIKCPGNYFVLLSCTLTYLLLIGLATLGLNLVGMLSFTVAAFWFITIIYMVVGVPYCILCLLEFAFTAIGTCPCLIVSVINVIAPLVDCLCLRYGIWGYTMVGRLEYNKELSNITTYPNSENVHHQNHQEQQQTITSAADGQQYHQNPDFQGGQYDREDIVNRHLLIEEEDGMIRQDIIGTGRKKEDGMIMSPTAPDVDMCQPSDY